MIAGIIYGQVTDQGRPVAGASVSTELPVTVTTLPTGHFLMFHPPGTFDMAALKPGCKPARKDNVVVGQGALVTVDFQL